MNKKIRVRKEGKRVYDSSVYYETKIRTCNHLGSAANKNAEASGT